MREWFKYSQGYVNIDDDSVYFTKTGNWSEVGGLEEKNAENFKQQDQSSKIKVISYFSIVAIIFLFGLYAGGVTLTVVIIMVAVAIAAYKYMIPEFGASFKIPKSKIEKVTVENEEIQISFVDQDGDHSQKTLRKVDTNSREILLQLNNS